MADNPCDAVKQPRSRLDKLGIHPDSVVSVLNLEDSAFLEELKARTPHVSVARVRKAADTVIYRADELGDLDWLRALRGAIVESGAVWVVWTKGRKALTEDHVRRAALAQGLVDVKVMAFSTELSGLKLVIPVAERTARPATTRPQPRFQPAAPPALAAPTGRWLVAWSAALLAVIGRSPCG